ncbi:MAG: hypothetical protein Q9225_004241 [Loekoesia sp. 1 TL-2023]
MPKPSLPTPKARGFEAESPAMIHSQQTRSNIKRNPILNFGKPTAQEIELVARNATLLPRSSGSRTNPARVSNRSISSLNIGASSVPSNKDIIPTNHKRLDSQLVQKTNLPSGRSTNRQNGNAKEAPFGKQRLKFLDLPRRNTSQQTARSASSVSTPTADTPEGSEALFEDTHRIQRELLQLHVLHSASGDTHTQWRESAKAHFQKKFEDLVERHVEIAEIAYQTKELKNRSALVDWCRNVQPSEVERRARTLSRCIEEIYENLDPGGKYYHITSTFEAWFARARRIRESRKSDALARAANLSYVEEIGAGWQNDVDALQRRLSTLTGDLRTLGSAPESSNLGQLLVLLQDLVIDMLAEVDCIRSIECETVAQEEIWIEEQIASLSLKVHNEMSGNKRTPGKRRGK